METHDEVITFQYIVWQDLYLKEKPFQLFLDIPSDAPDQRKTNIEFEHKEVVVQDIRANEETFSLDSHGFMVRRSGTLSSLVDMTTTSVESIYLPAVEEFLRAEVEGVDRVFFFDWRVGSLLHFPLKSKELIESATECLFSSS